NKDDVATKMTRRLVELFPHCVFDVFLKDSDKQKREKESRRKKERNRLETLTRDNIQEALLYEIRTKYPEKLATCTPIVENLIR
ncbi:hypothetical protein MRO55_25880, partial [Escherichia coli]|uniref:hypothetical protein n=1 Tax=Escherichia coli TaxID=562 RepID=UPI002113EA02